MHRMNSPIHPLQQFLDELIEEADLVAEDGNLVAALRISQQIRDAEERMLAIWPTVSCGGHLMG